MATAVMSKYFVTTLTHPSLLPLSSSLSSLLEYGPAERCDFATW